MRCGTNAFSSTSFVFPSIHMHESELSVYGSTDKASHETVQAPATSAEAHAPASRSEADPRTSFDSKITERQVPLAGSDRLGEAVEEQQVPQWPTRLRKPPELFGCLVEH